MILRSSICLLLFTALFASQNSFAEGCRITSVDEARDFALKALNEVEGYGCSGLARHTNIKVAALEKTNLGTPNYLPDFFYVFFSYTFVAVRTDIGCGGKFMGIARRPKNHEVMGTFIIKYNACQKSQDGLEPEHKIELTRDVRGS